MTFNSNVNMFLLSIIPTTRTYACTHTHTHTRMHTHTHTHLIYPVLILQLVNMEPVRKYRLLNAARGTRLVEALRYKPEIRGFDSRWYHWNFSLT